MKAKPGNDSSDAEPNRSSFLVDDFDVGPVIPSAKCMGKHRSRRYSCIIAIDKHSGMAIDFRLFPRSGKKRLQHEIQRMIRQLSQKT